MAKDVLGLVNVKTPSILDGECPMPVARGKEIEHIIVKRSGCPVDIEQYIQDTFRDLFMKHHEINMMCWEEHGRLHFAVVKYTLREIISQRYLSLSVATLSNSGQHSFARYILVHFPSS